MAISDYIPFLGKKPNNPPSRSPFPNKDEKDYRFIEQLQNFKISELTDYDSYLTASTERIWCSYRACDIAANTVLQTQFALVNTKGEEVDNREFQELLDKPNAFDTFEELLYLTAFHLKLTGNAYWFKDEIDTFGRPRALYPLLPQYIHIQADEKEKVKEYEYRVNGSSIFMKPEEVIHFKNPHPNNTIFGIGDIEPSTPLFNRFINNDKYSESFFKNGAFPSGVLVREEYDGDETDWERMKNKWTNQYTGTGSQGKTAWLNGKWSYIQLGLSNKDLQTIEQSELNTEQIFLAHGVPLSVAGIKEASNYATARQEYINFRRHTVLPMVKMIFSRINHQSGFVKAYNKNWKLSYKLSGLIDVEQASKDYELLIKYGAMTLNEYREACGLDKSMDENHDRYYTESTRVPLEIAGAESILVSERFRLPSEQELDDELQPNEIQLPDDPELNENESTDAEQEEAKGHHPNAVFENIDNVIVIDISKDAYDGYPKSAVENSKKSYAHRLAHNKRTGTKQLWSICNKIKKNEKLSFRDISYISKMSRLQYAKNLDYEKSNQSVQLDAIGGISMIKWAQDKYNKITNGSIDWNEKAKEDAPNYIKSDDEKRTCKSCMYSEGKTCKLYSFKYDEKYHCDDYKK